MLPDRTRPCIEFIVATNWKDPFLNDLNEMNFLDSGLFLLYYNFAAHF